MFAQSQGNIPKLVVSICIDQLRSDYLQAFAPLYGDNGFKMLLNEGKVYDRAINDFYPSDRASASATISSGATPYYNGIVSSSWLDRKTLRPVYCTDTKKGTETTYSANRLLCSTVGDELKVYTLGSAKVIGIAPERDEAILSVGHAADCAIWIDDKTGKWTSSSYYKQASAPWISAHERLNSIALNIGNRKWTPFSSLSGNISFFMNGGVQSPFSHSFTGDHKFVEYKRSALVNTDITDIALQAVSSNAMGNDGITDLLSLTYYAGTYKDVALSECHGELQDTYVRLDDSLARLIKGITDKIGRDNVLFVLTSTGYNSTDNADYNKFGIPSGTFYINRTANILNMYLSAIYGQEQYVDAVYHNQIYFNHDLLEKKRLSLTDILTRSREFLVMSEGVRDVHTTQTILSPNNDDIYKIRNAFNPSLNGDIIIEVVPGWKVVNEDSGETFTASATFSIFPIIFYGGGIAKEKVSTLVTTDCIAPTICKSIRIRAPNACKSLPLF